MTRLPIEPVLPQLREALRTRTSAVLVAPPGAGKTTRVPLALLDEPWLEGRRILILEPRRLAARSAARYMASSLGEPVGETVGYRVRLDAKVGPKTRIEVITEGVLTRLLQADPALEGVGLVIFDEFHERSLQADLGLALSLQAQALLREDLRILVMSATLDVEPIAALLGNAPVIRSEGRSYPVETRYAGRRVEGAIESAVVRTIQEALQRDQGDILVFLPGAGEIRRVEARLKELALGDQVRIAPLYGNLPQDAQDQAIAPCRPGERKIVLATSIAETSLTVAGIQVVIDSGLMRVPRFSPRTGMTRLETVKVSRASADQRRGRAGRLGPGVCYRLWTEQEDRHLPSHTTPEILEADLASLALELAVWGVTDPSELCWLDPPPKAAYAQARELLRQLGALDEAGGVTPYGRQMAALGLHPRLAHMIGKAQPLGYGGLACELAALLGEREVLRGREGASIADIRLRLEALRSFKRGEEPQGAAPLGYTLDAAACRRVLAEADRFKKALGGSATREDDSLEAIGILLAFAYPDRIAQRREGGRYLLSSGRGAFLPAEQPLSKEAYLVAVEVDDQGADGRIHLAAAVELAELRQHLGQTIVNEAVIAWDRPAQAVRARQRERLGALILSEGPLPNPDPEEMLAALLRGIAEEGLAILPWTRHARQLQERLQFMHHLEPGWPDVSDEGLTAALADWLAPHLYGMKSRDELQRLNLAGVLESMLSWEQRRMLDEYAPSHITVPSGSRIPVDYSDPAAPVLAVRLQEMFGLKETPRVGGGKVPLTLHLLSPAQRPVQVTRDLASFWQTAYFEVKKDLKGRYPKHYWPDDPLEAIPTNRTRPRQV
ncbi:ATP-dependent helicase HrpB [Brevibacillus sp. SYP-B805]|uniref:ATP-dependent helicase HrpB n=1 Tax=Brevibacillus sp. SYP-B805 TaxID=1578199 RepID=UPI0013EA21EB|nr:ATP-dependent helicase HrpB [Brevibacillus sp. SYP-B805]NGQ96171.1 ATP-dependent helicase HrpB [Brevibacillus sp. SYP-B805]